MRGLKTYYSYEASRHTTRMSTYEALRHTTRMRPQDIALVRGLKTSYSYEASRHSIGMRALFEGAHSTGMQHGTGMRDIALVSVPSSRAID